MHKILFLTTSNLTTNPRLFKEIQVASRQYHTSVLCFELGNWSDALDAQLRAAIPDATVHYIPAHRKKLLPWLFTAGGQKVAAMLWPFFKKNQFLTAIVSNKRSLQLYSHLLLHQKAFASFSLVVAHNLGALHPAQQLAKWLNIPFIFDVEDYHPGEKIVQDARQEKERREQLMRWLLPKASLVTAASPLIGTEVENMAGVKVQYISNSFYSTEFRLTKTPADEELKFVWFSQNINYGRGLEPFIRQLDQLHGRYSLTLIGNLHQAFAQEWILSRPYIRVLQPMEQTALHQELAKYDVGLALELRSADYNREIALTNKIFAYLQAGLFVLATDTKAQKHLLQEYSEHGLISEQTEEGLTKSVNFVLEHLSRIREEKEKRFRSAASLAYEREGQKLLTLWDGLVSKKHHEESNHRNAPFPPFKPGGGTS